MYREKKASDFVKHTVIYGVGSVASQVISFFLLPLYTHYLTPSDLGVLEIIQRTGDFVMLMLLVNGLRAATLTFFRQATTIRERASYVSTFTILLWLILVATALMAAFFAPTVSRWLSFENPAVFFWGLVSVLCEATLTIPLMLMQARLESWRFVITNVAVGVTRGSIILVTVVGFGLGIWGVLIGTALAFGCFGVWLTLKEIILYPVTPSLEKCGAVLRFTFPLLPAGLMGLIVNAGDRFLLLKYSGTEEVGIYALANRVMAAMGLVFAPFWRVWTARMFDYFADPDASRLVGRVYLRLLFVNIFAALGICIFGRDIVRLLATAEYEGAIGLLPALASGAVIATAATLFDAPIWISHKTYWKPVTMASACVTLIVVAFVLVPRFGAFGAAISLLAGYSVQAITTAVFSQRLFSVKLYWREFGVSCLLAALLAVLALLTGSGFVSWGLRLGLWLSWLPMLWFVGIFSSDEKEWLLGIGRTVFSFIYRQTKKVHVEPTTNRDDCYTALEGQQ
jgi:O-antigen/teichoic acid export membrane protein